ncbi:hypothetical protein ACFOON_14000 [Novosphingobium piscinae]|uniref:Uncharacterized protein n=1 Tax=Novosphingobium piscinae TaxID=1507448 RepID=A0A7X1FYR8_9SPHN|nr:hypothetical protein [Novosphingobium piscinae]MBC2668872.1 hypothetical protein [Novosphingobium piscinae]
MDRALIEAVTIVFGMALASVLCIAVTHWDGHAVVPDFANDPLPVERF